MPMLENFIYNARHNFIFAYVPKVACTNWKCILRYLDGHRDYLDNKIAHDRERNGLAYLSAMPGGNALLSDPRVPKFTFVRSPYTRVLSAYLNKVEPFTKDQAAARRDPYFFMIYQNIDRFRIERYSEKATVDFDCFIEWLMNSGDPLTRNEHWVPQNDILGVNEVRFDFMGKFEHLERDAQKLLDLMSCDIPFPSREAVKFPGTNAGDKAQRYYSRMTIAAVQKLYGDDFRYLGYDFLDLSNQDGSS